MNRSRIIRGAAASLAAAAVAATGLAGCAAPAAESCGVMTAGLLHELFDGWNAALATGDPEQVADRYAEGSILLPTLSDVPRTTREARLDYFEHFLENEPQGVITDDVTSIGCDVAVDTGTYVFTYGTTGQQIPARFTFVYEWDQATDEWLIISHHSSLDPEA